MSLAGFVTGALIVLALGGAASYAIARLASDRAQREAAGATGGDPERGRHAIRLYGCGSCHEIEGVAGAHATVAQPLNRFAFRGLIAGRLPNTTPNLITFLQDPRRIDPDTAMPDVGLSETEARDIAAYLYSTR